MGLRSTDESRGRRTIRSLFDFDVRGAGGRAAFAVIDHAGHGVVPTPTPVEFQRASGPVPSTVPPVAV